MTIIDDALDEDVDEMDTEVILAIKNMPDRANKSMLKQRRANIADDFAVGNLTQAEAVRLMKEREKDFLDWVEDDVRENLGETILRMKAQDFLAEKFYEKLQEEGII